MSDPQQTTQIEQNPDEDNDPEGYDAWTAAVRGHAVAPVAPALEGE